MRETPWRRSIRQGARAARALTAPSASICIGCAECPDLGKFYKRMNLRTNCASIPNCRSRDQLRGKPLDEMDSRGDEEAELEGKRGHESEAERTTRGQGEEASENAEAERGRRNLP